MGCPESLTALKQIEQNTSSKFENLSSIYDGLCSSISTVPKKILADTTTPDDALFTEFSVKLRSLGTNTYIGIGVMSQNIRLLSINDSKTYIAPILQGNSVPFMAGKLSVIGDGATGVLEISGIRVYPKAVI